MTRSALLLACAALLVLPGAATADPAAARCSARAGVDWTAAGPGFRIEAFADGPSCAGAVIVLVVRGPDGTPLFADAGAAAQHMGFEGAMDAAGMEAALTEWIGYGVREPATTSSLPVWRADQEAPALGEFPFYPEPGYDRAGYEAARAASAPLFCYVQGMESMACLMLSPQYGQVETIGVQTFPG